MSDVNVSVVAIDSAMDCFEKINNSAKSIVSIASQNCIELLEQIDRKRSKIAEQISELNDNFLVMCNYSDMEDDGFGFESDTLFDDISREQERLAVLSDLRSKVIRIRTENIGDINQKVITLSGVVSDGLREMAAYLREINSVGVISRGGGHSGSGANGHSVANIFSGESNYCVVVIDSTKYPESAEHIRSAIQAGHPAMLTLNRSGADENRRRSLSGIPVSSEYDRDEYPPAAFQEGGDGADVAYINPSDNQGSGASFRWQLNGVPDGTRVRFRVI